MTKEEAITDLIALKEFFEEQSDAYPICLEYAINELSAKSKTEEKDDA